ncbi:MAG: hypothetical protein ACYDGM_05885 [Vulcanimicrobiaceae bacterium]
MKKRVAYALVVIETLTVVLMLQAPAYAATTDLEPSCSVSGGALIADLPRGFSAVRPQTVVFDVRDGKRAPLFSAMVPILGRGVILRVDDSPTQSGGLMKRARTVSCFIAKTLGNTSESAKNGADCGVPEPVDMGIDLTVREIEVVGRHAYITLLASRVILGAIVRRDFSGEVVYATEGRRRIARATLYGFDPETVVLAVPLEAKFSQIAFKVKGAPAPIITACLTRPN